MRQYVIDELSREERANIESYLKRTLKPGPMEGLYWIEVPPDLLSGDQLGHGDCGPFFFAVELDEESACIQDLADKLEISVRFQVETAYSQEQYDVVLLERNVAHA